LQSILNNQGKYQVVGVVSDVECPALDRARRAAIPAELVELARGVNPQTREEWNKRLAEVVDKLQPDVVVSAGFMKILGAPFLSRFGGRTINTHPALLPAFPGAWAWVRTATSLAPSRAAASASEPRGAGADGFGWCVV